jgi:hypothetical protein
MDDGKIDTTESLLAGAVSGVTSTVVVYPLTLVRTRLLVSGKKVYNGIFDCMRKIYRNRGFFGLFAGLNASLYSILPFSSL